MENESINVVELFSGIGSQVKALHNLGVEVTTVATCEWDLHATIAYDLINNSNDIPEKIIGLSKEELLERLNLYTFSNTGKDALPQENLKTYSEVVLRRLYASIIKNNNFVDVNELKGSKLPGNIDILTYSFPCQDLSNVGAFHGYNKGIEKDSGSRSSLLWQVGRILSEMKKHRIEMPSFLLMENVPALLSSRHFNDFSTWINELRQLGYISKYYQLNSLDFGLPQNRPRLLMISVYVGEDIMLAETVLDFFKITDEDKVIRDYKARRTFREYTIGDLLRIDYSNQELFEEAIECTPNNTVSRRKIWDDNPKLVLEGNRINQKESFIRTITTKQDRNPNSGNLYFNSGIKGRSKFRYLTPRECLLFMGFKDEDYEALKYNNLEFHKGDALFARDKVIRLAGNSIPVNLLEGIFYQILLLSQILKENKKRETARLTDNNEEAIALIKKHMFSAGLRSRLSETPYPKSADIVYPKYQTAIYIRSCFHHGHDCEEGNKILNAPEYWKDKVQSIKENDRLCVQEALELGWQAIIVWKCDLYSSRFEEIMCMMENAIRKNECANTIPQVLDSSALKKKKAAG